MKVIKIDKTNFSSDLEQLKSQYRLIGPVKEEGKSFCNFKPLTGEMKPILTFSNTQLSPKSIALPKSEAMFTYSLDESREDHHLMQEVDKDYSPQAVIGIRPCDAKALVLVKKNYDTDDYRDPYWIRAYESTTFVGLACNSPCNTCFCTTANCGPFHETGLDVLLVDTEDAYMAKAITPKGLDFLKNAGWTAETDAPIEEMQENAEAKIKSFIQTDQLKDKSLLDLYNSPIWENEAFACINCGTCTFVCPTCWCFDVQDENHGNTGVRMRNWDSCMFSLFTLHGSGHNPRGEKFHRVRQRFMHKLKYFLDKYDDGIQCVGCGRCVRLCPVNIDIRRICDKLNNYQTQDGGACEVQQ